MEQPPSTSDDFNFIGGPYVSFGIIPEEDEHQ